MDVLAQAKKDMQEDGCCDIGALMDEIERLTACLKTANAQTEDYERRWYLTQAEIEQMRDTFAAIKAHCEPQPSPLAQSIALTCSRYLMKPEEPK